MPDAFRITQTIPGEQPRDITRIVSTCSWSSGVPGGFGAANFMIPRLLTQKERGLLGLVTVEHEGRVLFEGRVEDCFLTGARGSIATDLQAFGLQRLLAGTSVRRIWSIRNSLAPNQALAAQGASTAGTLVINTNAAWVFGRWDTNDPTKFGFQAQITAAFAVLDALQVGIVLPAGLAGARIMFDSYFGSTGNWNLVVHSTSGGGSYTRHIQQTMGIGGQVTSIDTALVPGATEIRIGATAVAGAQPLSAVLRVWNIRVLGTPLREDTAGGFYGGTILRDVVAQVPGLFPGTIEDGSDFVISELARVNRSPAKSVVDEITPLYSREWGVWEGGRFDWVTPDLKSSGWVIPIEQATGWSLEQSLEGVSNRTYVTYTDAADQQAKEAYADAKSTRNPFVRTGQLADVVVPAQAAMTSVTAPLLAAKINNDTGRYPDNRGSLTLPAGAMVDAANGARSVPAFAIRAGDNVTVPDLPVEDIYASGQDGQTTFRITRVSASTEGSVELTLEGLTRRADVLLARLAKVS